ncbi:MAG: hypothetical protein J6A13_06285 [Paludibacteraceae bacterium]|nr:hypothetical protein [Paludibacteraceae bacterium]
MKKFSLFLSAMLISMMSFAQGVTHDVVVENATTSPMGQNIVLSGTWEEKALTVMLWQGGATQGFGTYAADDYGPITLGVAELTPKAEGVYTDKGDGTFTFACTATDATDTYNISMKGALPATGGSEPVVVEATTAFNVENGELYVDVCEADYAWCLQFTISEYDGYGEYDVAGLYSTDNDFNVSGKLTVSYDEAKETDKIVGTLKTADNSLTVLVTLYKGAAEEEILTVPVTISNLTTTEMPVEGKTFLQLMGSNDMEGVELMLFIPDYTGEDKEYALDLTSYNLTLGGTELTLVEGALTKSTDDEKGDVFAGRVVATGEEEGETYTIALDLTMWSTPAIDIYIEDVTITVDEESAIAFFNADWEGTPLSVEVSGFEEVEFKEYIGATLTLGDDVNWVDAAFGPVAVIIEDGVASLEGEFTSFATGKTYNVELSGKLPVAEPLVKLTGDEDIYHFYLSQGVAVNTNPASPYYGYTYVTAATDGLADGGSDRADTQKRGIFVFDAELNCLNPENVGFLPANATALMTDVSRQAMHRIAINPVNDHVAFCYNVAGSSAVWSMDPANLAGDATNLIEGLAITAANAICFDEKGTLYVMDNANTADGGKIVKVVNGELITVAQNATWGNQDISLASDGRGGLWVAQNRWNVDTYAVLSHVNAAGEIDFKVTKDSPEEVKALFPQDANASYRGQCAYDAENHVLAFGGNKVVSLFKVYYDVITGVPSIEKLISTPAIGSNIDGVAFYDNGDFAVVSASAERFMKFACNIEIPVQAPLKGIVKRALTVGESTVVLTHEADGTPHIYNIKGEKFAEVSQVGVVPVDTANAGDYLAISDIAVTEDGKLVGVNYIMCQSGDEYVDEGYKRGENRFYIWNDLAGDPTLWFSSKMSSNWFRSKQGYTMALKGNSTNCQIILTGPHGKSDWGRFSIYNVIEGQYVEPDVNNNDYYHFHNAATDIYDNGTVGVLGENYQLNASPLTDSTWILDGNLVEPYEIIVPETNNVALENGATLSTDLGKKFNGATILKEGEQVLMVAPYADADGKLAGVKVLDITDGLAADSVVATLDLDAPVAATAAATAVEVAAYDANITLVADGFIYNLVYNLPKPERTETTVLNPFAYNLSSTLSEEGTTLTVNYTLNANADAVEVVILNGKEVLKTVPCKGINKGTYTVNIPTAGLPEDVDLTWSVNVKGTSVETPTQEEKMYSMYCPHGLAIDKDPESEYFGRILVADAMNVVKDKTGYLGSGIGAGLHVFNPSFTTDSTVYTGGNDFTRIWEANGYQPWRVKISEDGRIFVSSLDLNGVAVWEVSKDLQTWTPVIAGTQGEDGNILDAEGNFVAGMNVSMDVKGSGEDLTLLLYSCTTGAAAFSQSAFRLDEYALGTDTTWTGTPKNILTGGKYALVHTNAEFIYDGEGGYWFGASRAGNAGQPNLVHINAAGEQDYYTEDAGLYGGDGVLVHNGMLFKGKARTSSTVGNFGVWTIGKDEAGKVTLTEKWTVAANGIGRNLNEFAVDYAENLYVVGNSGEKIIAYALPYSGEVSTPAASKYAFTLESEPEYMTWEDEITNLVIDLENMAITGGPSTKMQVKVKLGLAEDDNMDGKWSLSPESSVSIMGFDARLIDGYVYDIDVNVPAAKAVLYVEDSGFFYEYKLNMTNTPTEATVVVVEDATVEIDTVPMFGDVVEYALKMTANWTDTTDNTTYPVLVEVPVYYPEATEPSEITCTVTIGGYGDDDPWLGFGEGTLTITTVDGVVTAKGIVSNPYTGVAFDVTISGKLPVEEPVKYTVTATVNPAEAGTVTGAGEYEEGAEATLTATAAEGYEFVNWTVAGAEVATTATYTFTVTADVEVVANFKEITDAVDNIQVGVKATKVIRNGQLIIIKNDVEYNAQGAVVK